MKYTAEDTIITAAKPTIIGQPFLIFCLKRTTANTADTAKAPRKVFEPEPMAQRKLMIVMIPQKAFFHIFLENTASTKNIGKTKAA